MTKRAQFMVSFDAPPGATPTEMTDYVRDVITSMKGCLQPPGQGPGGPDPDEPGNPMFYLDGGSVRVRRVHK